MSYMPMEPEAFAARVAGLVREMQPGYQIELSNPSELLVNGRRLDLENLYRMVKHEPDRGAEIVEHFLDQLFTGDALDMTEVPFEFARPRIMPRIQPVSIFDHLSRELVAYTPYVNDTVIVYVTDLPHMTVSITTEQTMRWGLQPDDLEEIARSNLEAYCPDMQTQVIESSEGGRAVILAEQDGYDAARLLLDDLYRRLAPELGGNFYVATPARDMFIALSSDPEPFLSRLAERIEEDYQRMPYPICKELFLVTRDGVAGTKLDAA